jgi:hypothetical protein
LAESIEATEMIYKYLTTAQAFYFWDKGASYERHVDEATCEQEQHVFLTEQGTQECSSHH